MDQTLVAPAIAAPSEAVAAFEALYRSSRDDVYAYVSGMLRDRSAAEDVTALAFERAYRRRASFKPDRGSHRGWLFGIARNAALDELRRRGRQAELTTEPEDPAAAGAHEEAAEAALRRSVIAAGMAKLTPRDRELIALKFYGDLANGEIAAVLGISESNVGTKLHRAMEKLREACDEG
ncbi:MAG: hypothetical protein QOI10_2903 [Solirubrobacterales bacterium]|jgi:RNA polymerase sigma-70 factor (ECF subfamily)|nr:hypothetical protein [Solirubrobacterales bacterium]